MTEIDFAERFTREKLLLGEEGLARLRAAHITICGLGGVGSYAAEAVARAGVGQLTLVDFDQVAASNINRQLYALGSTIGQYKVDLAAARIADINPECKLQLHKTFLNAENTSATIAATDAIIDAVDHVPAKVALIRYAKEQGIRIVSAMGAGKRLDPAKLRIADIRATSVCPLARIMRKELRNIGIDRDVTVVFSTEQPVVQSDNSALGSVSFVPSVAGLLLASVVLREIAGEMR